MGENNEAIRVMDWIVGLLMFCVVVACVAMLIGYAQERENKFVQGVRNSTNTSKQMRLSELEMIDEPVLCTAVADILAESDTGDILCVVIRDTITGVTTVYQYEDMNVGIMFMGGVGSTIESSNPIDESVKHLLSLSKRYCTLSIHNDAQTQITYAVIDIADEV